MQHSRFLVLTGHLNDYPLSDLVGILRHQRKTGRLLIDYPNSPASFFFNDGELVDAQLENLSGLQAVCVALAQPPSSFNFNPVIRPTRRSIENSLQKVVSELLGCWGENELEAEKITPGDHSPQPALLSSAALENAPQAVLNEAPTLLALPPGPANQLSRPILAIAAVGLLLLGLSTVIAVTGALGKRSSSSVSSHPNQPGNVSAASQSESQLQNPLRTESPNNSKAQRPVAKAKDAPVNLEHQARQEGAKSSLNKKETEISTQPEQASATIRPDTRVPQEQAHEGTAENRSVTVVLQIEGGRVAQASIANHRSGMEAYEALALRIARQRRYQSKGPTQETVTIKVSPPK